MDKKIVTPDDMGTGLIYDDTAKQFRAVSQVVFTNHEVTATLPAGAELIFRQVANSNRPMVCTGIKQGGKWFGDAPKNASSVNPFTNKPLEPLQAIDDIYAKKNGDESFNSISVGDYKVKTKKMIVTVPDFNKSVTVRTGILWDKYINISAKIEVNTNRYEIFNTFKFVMVKNLRDAIGIINTASVKYKGKKMILYITYEV